MPPYAKPGSLPRWADSGGSIAVPPAGVKDIGWVVDQEVPAEYLNWLDNLAYQWAAYLSTFEDNALTWSLAQRFTLAARFDAGADTYGVVQGKATTDAIGVVGDAVEPTDTWRLFAFSKLTAGGIYARRYVSGSGLAVIDTINASWSQGTGKWVADAAGTDAYGHLLATTGEQLMHKTAAANWATWDNTSTATATGTNTRTFDGPVAAKRFHAKGTALAVTDFALDANWGNTATVEQVYGCDGAWNVKVKANGAGIGADPTITLTYKDGTWGTSPVSIIKFTDSDDAAVAPSTTDVIYTTPSPSATSITFTLKGTPTGGKIYRFAGIVVGT